MLTYLDELPSKSQGSHCVGLLSPGVAGTLAACNSFTFILGVSTELLMPLQNVLYQARVVAVHAFDSSTWEAEALGMSCVPPSSIYQALPPTP